MMMKHRDRKQREAVPACQRRSQASVSSDRMPSKHHQKIRQRRQAGQHQQTHRKNRTRIVQIPTRAPRMRGSIMMPPAQKGRLRFLLEAPQGPRSVCNNNKTKILGAMTGMEIHNGTAVYRVRGPATRPRKVPVFHSRKNSMMPVIPIDSVSVTNARGKIALCRAGRVGSNRRFTCPRWHCTKGSPIKVCCDHEKTQHTRFCHTVEPFNTKRMKNHLAGYETPLPRSSGRKHHPANAGKCFLYCPAQSGLSLFCAFDSRRGMACHVGLPQNLGDKKTVRGPFSPLTKKVSLDRERHIQQLLATRKRPATKSGIGRLLRQCLPRGKSLRPSSGQSQRQLFSKTSTEAAS